MWPATEEDLTVIINGQICSNEIKDLPALLTDADLEYDEDGKIIITDEIRRLFPYFIPCIDKFNSETTVFKEAGHNYPIDSNVDPNEFFPLYTDSCLQSVDALLVSKDNQPIVLTKDMITTPCPDGQFVLSIKGSEIRTTGKNYKKVFTEKYLRKTLSDCGIDIDENGICHVEKTNPNVIGFVRGRGKTNYTRYKINHCFIVKNEENVLKDCGDHYEFAYNNILQIKCGISIHIQLNKTREEINQAFGFCKSSVVA